VAAIGLLLIVLTIGTVRRWRWLFWLLLIAFAWRLRVPVSIMRPGATGYTLWGCGRRYRGARSR
jgi:hypothetical protein